LDGKPEGSRLLGILSHRENDNINIDVTEAGWKNVNCVDLDWDRDYRWALVSTLINPPVP
jgi:hypothetical protein